MSYLSDARIRDAGESAISIELGEGIDPAVHDRVLALDAAISAAPIAGICETVPSYRALLVIYDAEQITRESLLSRLVGLNSQRAPRAPCIWSVPACFEGDCADDLAEIATYTGLSSDTIVDALTGSLLRLYMYGFAPGFAYLGGLDPRLAIPRRPTPRQSMPPGSLMLAAGQASIASVSMPTGWYVAGRTPVQMFRPELDQMVPFRPGDSIRFRAVATREFDSLRARAKAGESVCGSQP